VLNNDADIISSKINAERTAVNLNTVLNECDLHDTWRLFRRVIGDIVNSDQIGYIKGHRVFTPDR